MSIFNSILEWLEKFLHDVLQYLPTSPFKAYLSKISDLPYLEYVNYFIPIPEIIAITEAWIIVVGVYYIYSVALRWVKALE